MPVISQLPDPGDSIQLGFASLFSSFFIFILLPAGAVATATTTTATAAASLNIFPLIKISTSQTPGRKRQGLWGQKERERVWQTCPHKLTFA